MVSRTSLVIRCHQLHMCYMIVPSLSLTWRVVFLGALCVLCVCSGAPGPVLRVLKFASASSSELRAQLTLNYSCASMASQRLVAGYRSPAEICSLQITRRYVLIADMLIADNEHVFVDGEAVCVCGHYVCSRLSGHRAQASLAAGRDDFETFAWTPTPPVRMCSRVMWRLTPTRPPYGECCDD